MTWLIGWLVCSVAAVAWLLSNRVEMEVVGLAEQYRTPQDVVMDGAVLGIGALAGPVTLLALAAIWWAGRGETA